MGDGELSGLKPMYPITKRDLVEETLGRMDEAVRGLYRPMGKVTVTDGAFSSSADTYMFSLTTADHNGLDPWHWPEVIEVAEALTGAALVIAQEYIGKRGKTQIHADIGHLANYWKHRSDWGTTWVKAKAHAKTLNGIAALGGVAPTALGQLSAMAERAFGQRFYGGLLWDAISDIV